MVINMSCQAYRRTGHDFELKSRLSIDGRRWKLSLWYRLTPQIGDFIIFGFNENYVTIGYIERVTSCAAKDIYVIEINTHRGEAAYMEYKDYGVKRNRKIPAAVRPS